MIDLRFERIAQIIAVAVLGSSNDTISKYYVESCELRIRFSEYVKSQVHLNVVHGLFGRQLREYVETLRFLDGRPVYRETAERVLRYFYSDISDFLINNCNAVDVYMEVDTPNFSVPTVAIDLRCIGQEFKDGYKMIKSGELQLEDWKYTPALDYVKDEQDLLDKYRSYAFAVELKRYSESGSLVLIESR